MSDWALQIPAQHSTVTLTRAYTYHAYAVVCLCCWKVAASVHCVWPQVCVRCVCLVCAHCLWAIITNRFTIAESANKRWTRLHIIVFGYVPWCAARCIMHWNHINHVATCTLRNCSRTEPQVKLPGLQFYPPSPPPRLWYYAAYELFVDYLARQLILEQMLSVCPVIAH